MYEHIIWDWNGTLIDDLSLCVEIVNENLSQYNLPVVGLGYYRNHFGFPARDYYEGLGLPCQGEHFERISDYFIENYRKKQVECSLHPNAFNILRYFQKLGIDQSILSAGQENDVLRFLGSHGLKDFFSLVSGVQDVNADGKVGLAKLHQGKISIPSNKILMIGDTVHDHEVALVMKVDCILFSKGHNSRDRLIRTGRMVFDDMTELKEVIV